MAKYKEDIFVGAKFTNHAGELASIVSIQNARKVLIEWEDNQKHQSYTTVTQLRTTHFNNPYTPSVWGIGYIGQGKYDPKEDRESYLAWQGVMQRCMDPKLHLKFPSYSDKVISESWNCFQDFTEWFKGETLNKPKEDSWAVDKDILRSNIYGPETCVVVPKEINSLVLANNIRRGCFPIGVNLRPETGKYRARCQHGTGSPKALGEWDTVQQAFSAYETFKETYIKEVANKYKSVLSGRAYEALINYQVFIDD